MKNKLLIIFKTMTSYVLVSSVVILNFGFVMPVKAVDVGEPTLTIGSQSASIGNAINVSINASNFTDVEGMTFNVQYDTTLLTYTGYTQDALSGHGTLAINPTGDTIAINWFDASPLNVSNGAILTLNFTVISESSVNANLTFVGTQEINDSVANPITTTFVGGVISLNPGPTLSSIAITNPATKLVYTVGDALDITGLVITGTYSDASTKVETITTSNISGFNSSAPMTGQVLTITVGEQTITYIIDIVEPLSSAKDITSFSFSEGVGSINGTDITVSIPFGTDVTALVPTITITGESVSPLSGVANNFTVPVIYTVTAVDSSTQDYTVTVTIADDPVTIAFSAISATLASNNIVNNLDAVTSLNYTSFPGLYFEKRTNVADATTAIGRITFNSALDLSNDETNTFLQNLGTKMDANTPGTIGLDFTGTTDSLTLAGTSATIKFYGLNTLGFNEASTASEISAKLVAFDDLGNLLDISTLIPGEGTYLGACEVGGGCYVFTIDVNHFTKYEIDNTAPIVSGVENDGLYKDNVTITFNEGNAYLDGSEVPFESGSIVETEGSHNLVVTDEAGNQTSVSFTIDKTAPTVTKLGDGESDYQLPSLREELFGATIIFNEEINSTSKTAVERALTAGSDQSLTFHWGSGEISNRLRVSVTETITATFVNDVYADLTDLASNITVHALLIDSALDATQAPVEEGNVINLSADQDQGVINSDGAYVVNSGEDVNGGTLDVDPLTDGNNGALPQITINSTTSAGDVIIGIPDGAIITGPDDWDGTINIPTVKEITEANIPEETDKTTEVNKVIEIGFGDSMLTFSKAVRIKFVGDANKLIGYTRGDIFTKITTVCSADSQETGDALPAEGDCHINVGNDLIVWTKHFTKFVAFTQTAISSGGGGAVVYGGGGATTSTTYQTYNPATGETTIGATITTPTGETPATTETSTTPTTGEVLGTKIIADGALVRDDSKHIYVIKGNTKYHIANLAELAEYKGLAITDVDDADLLAYTTTTNKVYANKMLIRSKTDMKIYAIKEGKKQHVLSLEELRKNYLGLPIYNVSDMVLGQY